MPTVRFLLLVSLAVVLPLLPKVQLYWFNFFFHYLHLPFSWLDTFLHEISHGLVAVLTGGEIVKIHLRLNGGGECHYAGGWQMLVNFAGYAGASLWGAALYVGASSTVTVSSRLAIGVLLLVLISAWSKLIGLFALLGLTGVAGYSAALLAGIGLYLLAVSLVVRSSHPLATSILVFILLSGVLWVKDAESWLVLAVISLMIFVPLWFVQNRYIQLFVQFIGIYVLVNSTRSALALLSITRSGDDTRMANITKLPEVFWISVWALLSVALLLLLLRRSLRTAVR